MGRYDDAVKDLCTQVPSALCRRLGTDVGDVIQVTRHFENLSAATRQVDALLAADDRIALHIEFQAHAEPWFELRMLEYRARLLRLPELAHLRLAQHVVMLGRGSITCRVHDDELQYRFTVHYLRDEPVGPLLADPALAPFAALADLPDDDHRAQTLRAALDVIAQVSDPHTRTVLARAAVNLAALRLDRTTINRAWEDSTMPIPSLLQDIFDEGQEKGREELVASLLHQRFGPDDRIPAIAHGLAAIDIDACSARLARADSLDDLSRPDN